MAKSKKNRIRFQQLKALKNTRRFKKYTKHQNKFHRRRLKKQKRFRNPNSSNYIQQSMRERVRMPEEFSISKDLDKVLALIYKAKKLAENKRLKNFDFDFSKVIEIDDGAVTILLSLFHDMARDGKKVRINLPSNPSAKSYVQNSGFRKFFQDYKPEKDNLNVTLKKGSKTILQKDTVPIIHNAMRTVFGQNMKNQRLQGMLIELMTNSVNHAYLNNQREKSWYISTRHDTANKKVEFCFVDNGDGIINTINVRLKDILVPGEDRIKKAFEGAYRSRTKQKNRGRGLIVIKDNYDKNTVTGLKVVTNNVVLDFETGMAKKLSTPFSGTFYSWILDETCRS